MEWYLVALGIGMIMLAVGMVFYFMPENSFLTVLILLLILVFGVAGLISLTMGLKR